MPSIAFRLLPMPTTVPPSENLNHRWIVALQQGNTDLAERMLAMGAHPFDTLSDGPQRLTSTDLRQMPIVQDSLWGWAMQAPSVEVLERLGSVIERDLRAAGPDGKAWMLGAWANHRWAWATLLNRPQQPDRLAWLDQRLEDWLVGAPGRWDSNVRAPWGADWVTVAAHSPHVHHPMQEFHRRAVLHEVLDVGNAAAWAVPVLARRWGGPGPLGLGLDIDDLGAAPNLLMQAVMRGCYDLAAALVKVNASPGWHATVLGLTARLLYASIRRRDEPLDDHDAGLSHLLGALLASPVPLNGKAPGIGWTHASNGDERLIPESWPRDDSGRFPLTDCASRFTSRTPVLDVLHRWFKDQDAQRVDRPDPDVPDGIIGGLQAHDYQAVRQAWEARQLRDAAQPPDPGPTLPVPPWGRASQGDGAVAQATLMAGSTRPRARL